MIEPEYLQEEIKQVIDAVKPERKIRTYDFDEVVLRGRDSIEEPKPNTGLVVVASTEGHVTYPGTKCDHGGYIPSTHPDRDRAPYCSICYPYVLTIKE